MERDDANTRLTWREIYKLREDIAILKERQDRMGTRFELIIGLVIFVITTVITVSVPLWIALR